jgi:hypothetical protein
MWPSTSSSSPSALSPSSSSLPVSYSPYPPGVPYPYYPMSYPFAPSPHAPTLPYQMPINSSIHVPSYPPLVYPPYSITPSTISSLPHLTSYSHSHALVHVPGDSAPPVYPPSALVHPQSSFPSFFPPSAVSSSFSSVPNLSSDSEDFGSFQSSSQANDTIMSNQPQIQAEIIQSNAEKQNKQPEEDEEFIEFQSASKHIEIDQSKVEIPSPAPVAVAVAVLAPASIPSTPSVDSLLAQAFTLAFDPRNSNAPISQGISAFSTDKKIHQNHSHDNASSLPAKSSNSHPISTQRGRDLPPDLDAMLNSLVEGNGQTLNDEEFGDFSAASSISQTVQSSAISAPASTFNGFPESHGNVFVEPIEDDEFGDFQPANPPAFNGFPSIDNETQNSHSPVILHQSSISSLSQISSTSHHAQFALISAVTSKSISPPLSSSSIIANGIIQFDDDTFGGFESSVLPSSISSVSQSQHSNSLPVFPQTEIFVPLSSIPFQGFKADNFQDFPIAASSQSSSAVPSHIESSEIPQLSFPDPARCPHTISDADAVFKWLLQEEDYCSLNRLFSHHRVVLALQSQYKILLAEAVEDEDKLVAAMDIKRQLKRAQADREKVIKHILSVPHLKISSVYRVVSQTANSKLIKWCSYCTSAPSEFPDLVIAAKSEEDFNIVERKIQSIAQSQGQTLSSLISIIGIPSFLQTYFHHRLSQLLKRVEEFLKLGIELSSHYFSLKSSLLNYRTSSAILAATEPHRQFFSGLWFVVEVLNRLNNSQPHANPNPALTHCLSLITSLCSHTDWEMLKDFLPPPPSDSLSTSISLSPPHSFTCCLCFTPVSSFHSSAEFDFFSYHPQCLRMLEICSSE